MDLSTDQLLWGLIRNKLNLTELPSKKEKHNRAKRLGPNFLTTLLSPARMEVIASRLEAIATSSKGIATRSKGHY